MPVSLIETKFFRPQTREGLVERPRLDDLLGPQPRRLTLVSAPAGFGKTTLLAARLARVAGSRRLAWVALDEGDREAERFWTYVLTALERAAPGTGTAGLTLVAAGQPIEIVLTAVLNELSVLPDDLDLVLDDYHLAESPAIQPGMAMLVERLPPQVRLVISTRADPALPLSRLRARGELSEVRAADLRFTDEETAVFLADATGFDLETADVARLGARTEGWIASLQLAALSLRGRDDPVGFIAGFTGDDRYVVDYLVEEVLSHESAEVREFLTSTSILDRLTGPLCDAVTKTTGSGPMLESLERRNLFVVPLDDQRRWYRYHHLFGDVLRAHLISERPDVVNELHRRASRWYAAEGETEIAVRHALAAADLDTAAELIELALPELRRGRREGIIRRWVDELPHDVVAARPLLAAGFIGALMATNEFDAVPQRLTALQETLSRPAAELIVVDQPEFPRLPAAIETWWAGLALVSGDPAGAIAHADLATATAAEGDHVTIAAAAALTGLASWATGDLPAAHRGYAVAVEGLTKADFIADVLGCSLAVADLELSLGRLEDAGRTLQHALDLAERRWGDRPGVMRGTADMLVGLSRAAWHRNDLSLAADCLRQADDLGEAAGLPQNPYRWRVAMARLRSAEGDSGGVVSLLDDAERVYVGDFSPQIHPIHAMRARVQAAVGDISSAVAWACEHHVSEEDEMSYLREYEHLTFARILLAQHRTDPSAGTLPPAVRLLDRLLSAAESGGHSGTTLEVQVLRTIALRLSGESDAATDAPAHAVGLAEPDGWVRYFVDSGPEMPDALADLARVRPGSGFVRRLREAVSTEPAVSAVASVVSHPSTEGVGRLVDPLSDRELDVLRLLGSDLDGPAIARQLVVSLNTVRTHTKHIYTKLRVNNRRAAITKAHQLGLLSRGLPR